MSKIGGPFPSPNLLLVTTIYSIGGPFYSPISSGVDQNTRLVVRSFRSNFLGLTRMYNSCGPFLLSVYLTLPVTYETGRLFLSLVSSGAYDTV